MILYACSGDSKTSARPSPTQRFAKGRFSKEKDKLFAFAVLSVQDPKYKDLYNWFLKDKGFSFTIRDEKRYNNYREDGSYSSKGPEQLVEEGIFQFVSLQFYGVSFDNDWYILTEISYHEDTEKETVIKEIETKHLRRKNLFDASAYQPLSESSRHIDYQRATEILSKRLGKQLSWINDSHVVFEHFREIPRDQIPWEEVKQSVEYREFIGQPKVAVYFRQEQKSNINRAFENYINEAVFLPLAHNLRTQQPEKFVKTLGLYSERFPLIYPHSKEYVLCIMKVIDAKKHSRLYYFLYLLSSKQLFQWTKPEIKAVPGHHAEWILEDIKDLSTWGDEFSFHEPSVTMDDLRFWNEHVLKKEGDNFLYLKEIEYKPV